jgi:type VI secretion system secreted protein VgrG
MARKRFLNKKRYSGERRILLSRVERRSFPRLGGNFEVLAPRTKVYNCIAWSIGITNRWVWPGYTISAFDQLYGSYGYRRISTKDYRLQPGVQKIVLYGHVSKNGRIKCTHGARQLADGTWTSKLGKLPLIRHMSPDALNGPSYGRPIAVYVKS